MGWFRGRHVGISSSWVKPSCGQDVFSLIPVLLKQLVFPVLNILGREKVPCFDC